MKETTFSGTSILCLLRKSAFADPHFQCSDVIVDKGQRIMKISTRTDQRADVSTGETLANQTNYFDWQILEVHFEDCRLTTFP